MRDDKTTLKNFFGGLSQDSLKEIMGLANIKKLQYGEHFENTNRDTICVVLSGDLLFFSDEKSSEPVISLNEGECARQTLPRIIATPGAKSGAVAIVITKLVLDMLPEKTQLFLYKKVFENEKTRISQCLSSLEKSAEKKSLLLSSLKNACGYKHRDISGFEPVKKIMSKVQRLPSAIENIMSQISSENMTPRSLAEIIKNDPSLTGLVLKRINSSYYNLEKKISEINYAIFYLGVDQIYQIIVSEGLRSTLASNHEFQKLYFHSVIISHISSEIARITGISLPAVASTIALLHDLGQNVKFLLKEQNPKIIDLIDFMDPSELGSILLESWNMPPEMCKVIKYHDYLEFMEPDDLPEEVRIPAVNLYLSHLFYELIQERDDSYCKKAFEDECLAAVGWSDSSIRNILEKILMPEFERRAAIYPESFRTFLGIESQ